jgi:AcrR family transcriptional regulator
MDDGEETAAKPSRRRRSSGPVVRPAAPLSRQDLYRLVWSRPMNALAVEFGISANGLAKICDRLMIPHPPRGFWKAGGNSRASAPPPLPPAPDEASRQVMISGQRAASRRPRTRLPLAARRDQLAHAAAEIVRREGLNGVSMKRLAREVGVSEALAYTYFANLADLLVYIARREVADMTQSQLAERQKHATYVEQARGASLGYLKYVERRGGLLQTLLAHAGVRAALRREHRIRRAWNGQALATGISAELGVAEPYATAGTQILRAMSLRAGNLLGDRRISLDQADRLSRMMIDGGRRRLVALGREGG